ncbi:MAG: radical SAM family heme chaperone HemW [Betaproteobacteria bacterium AqS2]|uniref:Heme chaperone HemW n=1 Tax=Candidatus Amphirhobacter heronislandensis TaxID=1732024 RepID=A0A930UD92_9GAMM|nr:radical SAM family heme chaperone HemW [Betaproteobacteria bacterium AqS2]
MTPAAKPLGLYLHYPWCVRRCGYCDFNAHVAATPPQEEYFAALRAELRSWRQRLGPRRLATVFIGGGTPSLAPPHLVAELLAEAAGLFSLAADAEITLEANPDSFSESQAAGFAAAGVNRVSVGVQSFDDGLLQTLGRAHDGATARAALERALRLFDRANADLMYALPGQDAALALTDVAQAEACGLRHLSCYHLMLEPGTPFAKAPPANLPDPDAAADVEDAVHAQLAARGWERYEVSAWGRGGDRCRHNLGYWEFGDYLGVGAGAHGKITEADGTAWRWSNPRTPRGYLAACRRGAPGRGRRVPAADLAFEFMLNALRLARGFSAAQFEQATGQGIEAVAPQLAAAAARGWLRPEADGWRPTRRGFDLLQDLCALFVPEPPRRRIALQAA